jgi:type IV secretion system protein VirB6
MNGACTTSFGDIQVIRDVVGVVDCNARSLSEAGYHALSGPHSVFPIIVTALMTIYVALLGYRLMFGDGVRFADMPVAALKIGAILALTLNWSVFQTLVFDVAFKGPLEIAHMLDRPVVQNGVQRPAPDPLSGAQNAYTQLTLAAADFGKSAGQAGATPDSRDAAAAQALWKAAAALFAGTAGVLSVASVATGVLTAVGPVFIALFLLDVTRGLFVGWVRALATAALAPSVCWLTTSAMLLALKPWLTTLMQQRESHQLNPDTATAVAAMVFVFTGAQLALVAASAIIAMGFRLGGRAPASAAAGAAPVVAVSPGSPLADLGSLSRAQQLTQHLQRSYPTEAAGERLIGVEQTLAGDRRGSEWGAIAASRSDRLGENYRRNRFRDRSLMRGGASA